MKKLLLCLVGVFCLTGCPPELTCEDVGCPNGESCNVGTGLCEAPVLNCNQNPGLCRSNELCDAATGRCLSNQLSCINQRACPLGQACNAETGICQNVGNCRSAQDCSTSEVCDLDSGQCQPKPCTQDTTCDEGFVCDANRCITGCTTTRLCPSEAICRIPDNQRVGQCISSCSQDSDCNFGRYCNVLKTPPVCDPEAPCARDDNCRSDEVCRDFVCVRPPCTINDECAEDQVCDASSGICVGGNCIEDIFSPNHNYLQAKPLPQGTVVQLNHCPGRPDWYVLDVNNEEFIQLQLEHGPAQDLDLILYDESLKPLKEDQRLGTTARIEHQSTKAQKLYVKVTSDRFNNSTYSMTLGRRQNGLCIDDEMEDNDELKSATKLDIQPGDVLSIPTKVCTGDEDWYSIGPLDKSNGITLNITPDQNFQVEASLFTPDGQTLHSTQDPALLSMIRAGFSGEYLLRIKSLRGQSGQVRLNMGITSQWACPDVEFNNDPDMATPLVSQTLENFVLCPQQDGWEVDWYKLDPAQSQGVVSIKVARPESQLPSKPEALNITLFEVKDNESPRPIRQATMVQNRTQTIEVTTQPDQALYIRVTANETPGRLWQTPIYQIFYQHTPSDP